MITLLRSYENFLLNFTQNIYELFSLLIFLLPMAEWKLSRKELNKHSEDSFLLEHIVTISIFIICWTLFLSPLRYIWNDHISFLKCSISSQLMLEYKMLNKTFLTEICYWSLIFQLLLISFFSLSISIWYHQEYDIIDKNMCIVIESWFSVLGRVETHSKIIILLLIFNRDWVWKQKEIKNMYNINFMENKQQCKCQ